MSKPSVAGSLNGVRTVALFEAAKGAVVLIAGFGLFALLHHDIQQGADRLVERLHLNPASRFPRIFIHAMSDMTNGGLRLLAVGAAAYASIRLAEAYGLWRRRRWAEWLAVLSGAIYLPIETYELLKSFSWLKICLFLSNVLVVVYMTRELRRNREKDIPQTTPTP